MQQSTLTSGKVHFIIINFIRLLLLAATLGSYFSQRWLIFTIALIALLTTFIPIILSKKYDIQVSAELELMIILFIYGTLFLSEVRGFYAEFWWWDVLLNLFSAIALGFVGLTILSVLEKEDKIEANPLMISVLAFTFAFALAGLWEILEFSLDYLLNTSLQQLSLEDTMIDLITAAIGSALVSISGYFYIRSGETQMLSGIVLKFINRYPKIFKKKTNIQDKTLELIKRGESQKLEFKATLRTNIYTNQPDKNMELSVLKTLVAFLNTKGGTLLIGISDQGSLEGIEKDNFLTKDKALLHLTNLIKFHIGNSFSSFIEQEIITIDSKQIMKISCNPSNKRVFLKHNNQEEFYIRNGPASVKLDGNSLIDYVENRFRKD